MGMTEYEDSGNILTDKREIATSETWESQTDWEAYQSINNIEIENGIISLSTSDAAAIPENVVDNFEDSDADPPGVYDEGETIYDYYSGDSDFSRSETVTLDGSYSLKLPYDSGLRIYSLEGDGLNRYPVKGEVFSCYFYSTGGKPIWLFGVDFDGGVDGYLAYNEPSDDNARIAKLAGDEFTELAASSVSYNENEWYESEIEWHDGSGSEPDNTIVYNLYEIDSELNRTDLLVTLSTTDSDFADNSGIGFRTARSDDAFVDRYTVLGDVE